MRAFDFLVFFSCLLAAAPIAMAQSGEAVDSGVQLFERGQLSEAQQFFEHFVVAQPNDPLGAFYLGRIAFEEQHYDRAIEWFEKAVEQESANSDYHLWLGRAYGQQALRSNILIQPFLAKKVKAHFEQAVALNPDNLAARADLQEYYEKAPGFLGGSPEKARQQAEEIARRQLRQVQR
jgi:tetratricopeptide (TPR) repeat protein